MKSCYGPYLSLLAFLFAGVGMGRAEIRSEGVASELKFTITQAEVQEALDGLRYSNALDAGFWEGRKIQGVLQGPINLETTKFLMTFLPAANPGLPGRVKINHEATVIWPGRTGNAAADVIKGLLGGRDWFKAEVILDDAFKMLPTNRKAWSLHICGDPLATVSARAHGSLVGSWGETSNQDEAVVDYMTALGCIKLADFDALFAHVPEALLTQRPEVRILPTAMEIIFKVNHFDRFATPASRGPVDKPPFPPLPPIPPGFGP